MFGLTVLLIVGQTVVKLHGWFGTHLGWDFEHYVAAARKWLATGNPYDPKLLTGPFVADATTMPFLHPPTALPLFGVFTVLPALLWWITPLAVTGVLVCYWRPSGWAWYAVLACCAWPRTIDIILVGNSDMWIATFVATGLGWGWPAALILAKPSAAVLTLIGMHHRGWWVGIVIVAAVAAPFGSLWLDWARIAANASGSLGYLAAAVPLYLLPIAAWAGRANRPGRRTYGSGSRHGGHPSH